jgi:hypothetical protein
MEESSIHSTDLGDLLAGCQAVMMKSKGIDHIESTAQASWGSSPSENFAGPQVRRQSSRFSQSEVEGLRDETVADVL